LIHDFANAQAMTRPGLCSFDIFTDEGEQHIVTLARWKDRAAFEEYKRSESGVRASQMALVLNPMVYFLRPEATLADAAMPWRRTG
jgi:quinol monooxygenase YgiN